MLRPTAINVEPLPDFKLRISFDDGTSGIVDVSPYIKGEWYGHLADPDYFNKVQTDGYTGSCRKLVGRAGHLSALGVFPCCLPDLEEEIVIIPDSVGLSPDVLDK